MLAVGFVIVPRPHTESGHRHDAHAHPDDRATQRGGARYARRLETRGGRGAEGGHHHAGALRHVQATGHVVALGKCVVSGEAVHHGAHHAGDFRERTAAQPAELGLRFQHARAHPDLGPAPDQARSVRQHAQVVRQRRVVDRLGTRGHEPHAGQADTDRAQHLPRNGGLFKAFDIAQFLVNGVQALDQALRVVAELGQRAVFDRVDGLVHLLGRHAHQLGKARIPHAGQRILGLLDAGRIVAVQPLQPAQHVGLDVGVGKLLTQPDAAVGQLGRPAQVGVDEEVQHALAHGPRREVRVGLQRGRDSRARGGVVEGLFQRFDARIAGGAVVGALPQRSHLRQQLLAVVRERLLHALAVGLPVGIVLQLVGGVVGDRLLQLIGRHGAALVLDQPADLLHVPGIGARVFRDFFAELGGAGLDHVLRDRGIVAVEALLLRLLAEGDGVVGPAAFGDVLRHRRRIPHAHLEHAVHVGLAGRRVEAALQHSERGAHLLFADDGGLVRVLIDLGVLLQLG